MINGLRSSRIGPKLTEIRASKVKKKRKTYGVSCGRWLERVARHRAERDGPDRRVLREDVAARAAPELEDGDAAVRAGDRELVRVRAHAARVDVRAAVPRERRLGRREERRAAPGAVFRGRARRAEPHPLDAAAVEPDRDVLRARRERDRADLCPGNSFNFTST